MCSEECESVGYHPEECEVFCKAQYFPKSEDFYDEEKPVYESLLPLRCYLQQEFNPKKWKALISLESHNDIRRGKELWNREQVSKKIEAFWLSNRVTTGLMQQIFNQSNAI